MPDHAKEYSFSVLFTAHRNNKIQKRLESHAVCRGNQHCLYYRLKLGKHNTSRGLNTPAHAIQVKPSTYPPHQTLGGQKKPHQDRRRKSG